MQEAQQQRDLTADCRERVQDERAEAQRLLAEWTSELQGMTGQPVQDMEVANDVELQQRVAAKEEEVNLLCIWHIVWWGF